MKRKNLSQKLDSLNESLKYQKLLKLTPENSVHNLNLINWFIDGGKIIVMLRNTNHPFTYTFTLKKGNVLLKEFLFVRQKEFDLKQPYSFNAIFNNSSQKTVALTALAHFYRNNSNVDIHTNISNDRKYRGKYYDYKMSRLKAVLDYLKTNCPYMSHSEVALIKAKSNTVKGFFQM